MEKNWERSAKIFRHCQAIGDGPVYPSLGQKWLPTVLDTKNTCSQQVGWSMHPRCLDFFSLTFVPFKFPICSLSSQCCSPSVFPIAPRFNPICFAQSPPLLTYIGKPKGEALHLSIESSILGEPPSFQLLVLQWANHPIKINHCKKKKVGLVRHPQLISSTHTIVGKWECLLLNTLGGRNLGGLKLNSWVCHKPLSHTLNHTLLSTITSNTILKSNGFFPIISNRIIKTNSNIHLTYRFHKHPHSLCFSKYSFCICILQSYHIYSTLPKLRLHTFPNLSTFVNYFSVHLQVHLVCPKVQNPSNNF